MILKRKNPEVDVERNFVLELSWRQTIDGISYGFGKNEFFAHWNDAQSYATHYRADPSWVPVGGVDGFVAGPYKTSWT